MAEVHYVDPGYVAPAYYQTGLSIDWAAKVIHVPKMFLTVLSGSAFTLDTNLFRLALRDIEDGEEGMPQPKTHNHNTQVVLAGVTYARVFEILAPYTVTFEDGQYSVELVGSNNNIGEKTNINQVSVRANNSAGLQVVTTQNTALAALEASVAELHTRLDLNTLKPNTYANDGSSIVNSDFTLTKTDNGNGTSTVQRS